MTEKPILFSAEMVRAILDGRKTQTRRVVKPQPSEGWHPEVGSYAPTCVDRHGEEYPGSEVYGASDEDEGRISPYGQPGDRLWVRETMHRDETGEWHYSADCKVVTVPTSDTEKVTALRVWAHHKEGDTCVSIHMPRWASRIMLEVTKVRVERVQDISKADAIAEGIDERPGDLMSPQEYYSVLWDKINAKREGGIYAWEKNPWVWPIEFKKL